MAKINLNTQTKNLACVINFPIVGDTFEDMEIISSLSLRLQAYLRTTFDEWSYILHACDSLDDDESDFVEEGEPKQGDILEELKPYQFYKDQGLKVPHIHLVLRSPTRTRLMTWLIRLSNALGYTKEQRNLVSVDVCKCFPFAIQYLTHLNHAEKYQYSREMIITSLTDKQLEFYFSSNGLYLDSHTLLELCQRSNSLTEIMLEIGLETFLRYQSAIKTMFIECKHNPTILYQPQPKEKPIYKPCD